ncbi:hypothetical protein J437_LFUL007748 [Ladona fulva]|uniref:HTH CENPB-type domain-containing protein n=1 Tax=Ladona fulva TaxID=123851 RepID=A0A8K0KFJ1_LADFU|nr:hypothetical protein J437_LFUL007748 [Ladona fulva]
MTESDESFVASKGWLDRFKHCHGIRCLKIIGEKLSSNESTIEPVRIELLLRVIDEKNLSSEQFYNADESELFWRMLPDKILADLNEKVAPGRKVIKAKITFMPCANVTGKHKLPLFAVGTAKKPRAFESPVCYREQKNASVTRNRIITEFFPAVRQHMKSVDLPQQALLMLDNCSGHPFA